MPETNEIPSTGDARVDAALERIRGKFRDVEDAMVVQAYLNRDSARVVKQVAERMEWLEQQLEREADERKIKDAAIDARVDKLVSAIGDLIQRIPPQNLR
jgi:hypothetical protein